MAEASPWKAIAALKKQGRRDEALAQLRHAVRRDLLDAEELERAGRFLAERPHDGAPVVRVLGQCTTSWLSPMIAATAWGRGLALNVVDGAFDNVVQELTSAPRSDGELVVLLPWGARGGDDLALWRQAWQLAGDRRARIVQVGYDWLGPGPLGQHLAGRPGGDLAIARELDAQLRAELPPGAYFVDLQAVSGQLGRARFYDARQYHWTKQPFSMPGAAELARHIVAGIRALVTGPKKVLVLDLDNTLWGGVVGETGPLGVALGGTPDGEAFTAFQRHCRGLARRGVLLAVASKNNPADAREPFGAHPDTVLVLDDFAAFEASWDPKAIALQRIADTLSLGLDSFVFFDDNPAEREHIRQALPEVEVVEVPDEPADYVRALEAGLWFEATALTDEDRARTQQYAVERRRIELRGTTTSLDDYLASLEMVARVRELDDTDMQRAVQLIGKTNQWNLTTRRHAEDDVRALVAGGGLALTVRLRDRFGDYGLVAVVIGARRGDDLAIDTWLMSCRVIGRTLEQLVLAELVRRATDAGYRRLLGEYRPTAKNVLVARLYDDLGFAPLDGHHPEGTPGGATAYALALPARALPRTFVALE